jgi:hypothetical protein
MDTHEVSERLLVYGVRAIRVANFAICLLLFAI